MRGYLAIFASAASVFFGIACSSSEEPLLRSGRVDGSVASEFFTEPRDIIQTGDSDTDPDTGSEPDETPDIESDGVSDVEDLREEPPPTDVGEEVDTDTRPDVDPEAETEITAELADGSEEAVADAADVTVACDVPDLEELPSTGSWLRIGGGVGDYEPLVPCQEVDLILGFQGGSHIWGGLIGDGFDRVNAAMAFTLTVDGEVVAERAVVDTLLSVDDHFEYSTVQVQLFGEPEEIDGRRAVLSVEFTSLEGIELSDSVAIFLKCCEF
jgi:hypothetical protein